MSLTTDPPNGFLDRASANETAAQLVSPSQPSLGELSTPEVAQHLGRSLAWVKRHARELGGRLIDGAYQFPSIEIERRRTTVEKITLGGAAPRAERARDRGMLAAKCFPLFQAATPLPDVVERLEADPDEVLALHEKWLVLRERTAQWLAGPAPAAPGPRYDHEAAPDGACCAGHMAARRMQEGK